MSSNFKKRLKQLHGSRKRLRRSDSEVDEPRVFTADDSPPHLGEGLDSPRPPIIDKWRSHGAKSRTTPRGEAHFLVQSHREHHQHGRLRLSEGPVVELDRFQKQLNDNRLHSADPRRLAFLDLETNGLSKSSFPFCIGIGIWDASSFEVYHFLTPTEEDEPAALYAGLDLLDGCDGLCTFNGSSFDLRMLDRRFRHHGIDNRLDELPHLDLLHLARKILPERDGHKLSQLEEDVLAFGRTDDIPGAKIPRRWKQYLKAGEPGLLLDVFDHNRLDILSMVVLLPALAQKIDSTPAPDRLTSRQGGAGASGSDEQHQPQSKLASRLSRTYALRKKAGSGNKRTPERAKKDRDNIQLQGSFSRSDLRKGMPIGTRLRELRSEVERLLGNGRNDEAVARLHEMVALAPQNPFALEKLVDHYRKNGEPALAEHFQKRLAESSPF